MLHFGEGKKWRGTGYRWYSEGGDIDFSGGYLRKERAGCAISSVAQTKYHRGEGETRPVGLESLSSKRAPSPVKSI